MKKTAPKKSQSSLDISFCFKPKEIGLEKWVNLMEIQERDMIVLEIREEIIGKVLNACEKIYMRRRSIDLLLDCAYEAWKRIIYLYHLPHDPSCDYYIDNPLWCADIEPKKCSPDRWSTKHVSYNAPKDVVKVEEYVSSSESKEYAKGIKDMFLEEEIQEGEEEENEDVSIDLSMGSNLDYPVLSTSGLTQSNVYALSTPNSGISLSGLSPASTFTLTKTMRKSKLPHVQGSLKKNHSVQFRRKFVTDRVYEPKKLRLISHMRLDVKYRLHCSGSSISFRSKKLSSSKNRITFSSSRSSKHLAKS